MSESIPNSAPLGGTELHFGYIKAAFPDLVSQVQFILSRPLETVLEDKPRLLYLQDCATDPASACLRDRAYRTSFNRLVFCSHRQQYEYHTFLAIPYSEGIIIKNSVPLLSPTFPKPLVDGKLQFIYTSTPHRGLEILAAVADHLVKERQDWQLHVYSSLNIYGWHDADKQFEGLYERLRANPCVVYHGSQPNAVVRQAVLDAHVFVYPSTYAEMSCMAIQEAMMAGCLTITSSLGALPETCGEWAWMFPFSEDPDRMAGHTYNLMKQALNSYDHAYIGAVLHAQSQYYQNFYAFEQRAPLWKSVLEAIIAEGTPVEKFIVE